MVLGPILTLSFLAGARHSLTLGEAAAFGHGASILCWVSIPRLQQRRSEAATWGHADAPVHDPAYPIDLVFLAGLAGLVAWAGAIAVRVLVPLGPTQRTLHRLLWIAIASLGARRIEGSFGFFVMDCASKSAETHVTRIVMMKANPFETKAN